MSLKKNIKHTIVTQLDELGRKKFTLNEGKQQQSQEKSEKLINTGRYDNTLLSRDKSLNIEKYIGKLQNRNKKKKVTEVFYCEVCKEGFKCDMAFLTHMNSPSHNKKLGMQMKVKNVSLDSVANKIKQLLNINQRQQSELLKNIEEKQEQLVFDVKEEQKQPSKESQSNSNNNQQELMRSMGLPTSFGRKKIKRF